MSTFHIFTIEPSIDEDGYDVVTPTGHVLQGFERLVDILFYLKNTYKTDQIEFLGREIVVSSPSIKTIPEHSRAQIKALAYNKFMKDIGELNE